MNLFFVGDLYYSPNKTNKKMEFGIDLLNEIRSTDLFCVNLEGAMTLGKATQSDMRKKGPCIRQDSVRIKKFIEVVSEGDGANILLTEANNHIMDYKREGLQFTNQEINELNTKVSMIGAGNYEEAYIPFIYEKGGISVGIISIAEAGFGVAKSELDKYGYAWFLHEKVFDNIKRLREKCDYVIVVSHAGLEEIDIPLPEIRKVYKNFIDVGADLIIGHHPHVIQGKENYKSGTIYYSLGNFMFDEEDGDAEYNGQSIGVKVTLGKKNIIEEVPLLYCAGVIDYSCESQSIFNDVCKKLQSDRYIEIINDICEKFYLEVYKGYYCNVHGLEGKILNLAKVLKALITKKELFDEDWLFHNLEIETHRWTVMRGMEQHKRRGVE